MSTASVGDLYCGKGTASGGDLYRSASTASCGESVLQGKYCLRRRICTAEKLPRQSRLAARYASTTTRSHQPIQAGRTLCFPNQGQATTHPGWPYVTLQTSSAQRGTNIRGPLYDNETHLTNRCSTNSTLKAEYAQVANYLSARPRSLNLLA